MGEYCILFVFHFDLVFLEVQESTEQYWEHWCKAEQQDGSGDGD